MWLWEKSVARLMRKMERMEKGGRVFQDALLLEIAGFGVGVLGDYGFVFSLVYFSLNLA